MFRAVWGVVVAIGMAVAYLALIAAATVAAGWQKLTGSQKRDELFGTDEDPY